MNNLGVAAFATGTIIPTISLSFFQHPYVFGIITFAAGVGIGMFLMWRHKNT
jgi:hypothetical protein